MEYVLPTRFWLDGNHVLVVVLVLGVGLATLAGELKVTISSSTNDSPLRIPLSIGLASSPGLACLAGALMLFRIPGLSTITRVSYTLLDVTLAIVIGATILAFLYGASSVTKEKVMCEKKKGYQKPEVFEEQSDVCS